MVICFSPCLRLHTSFYRSCTSKENFQVNRVPPRCYFVWESAEPIPIPRPALSSSETHAPLRMNAGCSLLRFGLCLAPGVPKVMPPPEGANPTLASSCPWSEFSPSSLCLWPPVAVSATLCRAVVARGGRRVPHCVLFRIRPAVHCSRGFILWCACIVSWAAVKSSLFFLSDPRVRGSSRSSPSGSRAFFVFRDIKSKSN